MVSLESTLLQITELLLFASCVAVTASSLDTIDIEYRVVGILPEKSQINDTIAVVVDDTPYPLSLSANDNLTYIGSAPIATEEYYYGHINPDNDNEVTSREPFTRQPKQSNTDYEFYNRSQTYWDIPPLPQLYDPLFHRKHSDLHLDGQIGAIHLRANTTDLTNLHENPLDEDAYVIGNMTFIR